MCRKIIAYLLVVAILANVGCSNVPVPLPNSPFPLPEAAQDVLSDVAIRQIATIWKDDIPIKHTEPVFYPTVERLPGAAFTPTPLPSPLEDTTPIGPGDYEIPAHFYCARFFTYNGSGYGYRLAKFQGKFADALTQLYVRASKAGTPTHDVQILSWSLLAGVAYDDLEPRQRALVDRLIPEYREQMQLGLTEKLMRDWNTWSSRLPIPSFNAILTKMGDVGAYIQTLMRARQEILNKNYNYPALWSEFVPKYDAPVPVDRDKTPWSRIHDRIFMRFIAPHGAGHDGVIQLRILDSYSQHPPLSNPTLVTQPRPDRRADACALSGSLGCNQRALDTLERLAGPQLTQVALADSLEPDDLTPTILALEPILPQVITPSPPPPQVITPSPILIPTAGAISWISLLTITLAVIAVALGVSVYFQSMTATTKTPSPEPRPTTDPIPPLPEPPEKKRNDCMERFMDLEVPVPACAEPLITRDKVIIDQFFKNDPEVLKDKARRKALEEQCRYFASILPYQDDDRKGHNECYPGPGEIYHCPDIRNNTEISIYGCLCCKLDGETDYEWRNPHPSLGEGD
jgi:hypothetical protein